MALCSYTGPRGGKCKRPAATESERCLLHIIEDDEQESQANELINTVLENPNVRKGVNKVNNLLDRFASVIDKAAKGEIPFFTPKPVVAPKGDPVLKARAILHFSSDEPLTVEAIKSRRKVLARLAHPDATANGSNDAMIRINKATEILIASLSG